MEFWILLCITGCFTFFIGVMIGILWLEKAMCDVIDDFFVSKNKHRFFYDYKNYLSYKDSDKIEVYKKNMLDAQSKTGQYKKEVKSLKKGMKKLQRKHTKLQKENECLKKRLCDEELEWEEKE